MEKWISKSEQETMEIAARVAAGLRGGEVLLLEGELGAGKTTFVRGLARAFGIKKPIRSPTFTLMQVYRIMNKELGIRELVHVDAYRLKTSRDLLNLSLEEYLGKKDALIVIEWGAKARALSRNAVRVQFIHKDQHTRIIWMRND